MSWDGNGQVPTSPRVRGTGEPVLLIPGGAASVFGFFADVEDALAQRFAVVLYERQGAGLRSAEPVPAPDHQIAEVAAAVRAVTDRPAVVVAQSLGGPIALQLALDAPDIVRAVLLLDPTPFNDPTTCRRAARVFTWAERPGLRQVFGVATKLQMRREVPPGSPARERARADLESIDPGPTSTMLRAWMGGFPELFRRLSADAHIPGLLVTADRKLQSRVRRAHEELAIAAGLRLECWPGTSHVMHLQATGRIVDTVTRLADARAR